MKRLPKPSLAENQDEEDRAPYCTPTYAAMEAGASWVLLGHPKTAIPILEKSRSEWADHTEVRDYALCVSRLALAYAAAGDVERACAAADEVVALAQGLGSRRVVASSACSTVGWRGGDGILPWLACEGG